MAEKECQPRSKSRASARTSASEPSASAGQQISIPVQISNAQRQVGNANAQRLALFRQTSTEEYPVTANAVIGKLEPWVALLNVHSAVTPKVNIIGSKNTHRKPMLCRP